MARRLRRVAPPIGPGALALRITTCALLLMAGFALVATAPVQWVFSKVAMAIAAIVEALLQLVGSDVAREGIILRDLATGEAVAVTPACDGSGLLVVLIAALAAFLGHARRLRGAAVFLVLAFAVVEVFNLARVGVLFGIGPANTAAFERAHYLGFPLASAVLLAMLLAVLLPGTLRAAALGRVALIGLAAAGLAVPWAFYGSGIAAVVLVPVADAWLGLIGPDVLEGFKQFGADTVAVTRLVEGRDPVSYLSAPMRPGDFMVAAPLVAATAVLLVRRPIILALTLAAALATMGLALALGAITGAHDAAIAVGLVDTVQAGLYIATGTYQPPDELMLGLLKALQNAAVHFNLFVLPFLAPVALTGDGRRAMAAAMAGR